MLLAIVAQRRTATNTALAAAAPHGVDARILVPEQASSLLQPGAVALGRLDVADALDGVEDGLWALGSLAARGVVVLNRAGALLAAHDKLLTAKVLQRAGLPHPRTRILHPGGHGPGLGWACRRQAPLRQLGPRRRALRATRSPSGAISARSSTGSGSSGTARSCRSSSRLPGFDLRIVVAAGVAVGAISRVAAPGEWRTNIALGGTRVAVDPPAGGDRARRPRRRGRAAST